MGHEVAFAFDTKRGAFNDYEEAAEPHVTQSGLPILPLTLSAKSSAWEMVKDVHKLRGQMGAFDVIHSHLSHDHVLSVMAGAGRSGKAILVRTAHSERPAQPRFGQMWLNECVSGWIRRDATLALPGDVQTIDGSIDTGRFVPRPQSRDAVRERLGVPKDAWCVGHVALMADRGQELLVRAAAKLSDPNVHVVLVGRGEGENALRDLVSQLHMHTHVHFAGYADQTLLPQVYAGFDVAFCGKQGNDASMRSALEAMACGVPLLGNMMALGQQSDGVAVGYPTNLSVEEICEGLRTARADAQREQKAQGARTWVQKHRTLQDEAHQTVSFYERCLATSSS